MKYPVEALLRPPIELWSASTALVGAVCIWMCQDSVPLQSVFEYVAIGVLVALGLFRLRQGVWLLQYQRGLTKSQILLLPFTNLPKRTGLVYLGNGFRWTHKHTQRLKDTERVECQKYLKPNPKRTSWLRSLLRQNNQQTTGLPESGNPAIHGVEPKTQPVWLDARERVGHTLVLGTTRVGKTRFAELLIAQDIHRDEVVLVFDPKGDADLLRRVYAEAVRAGKEDRFYVFHLGHPKYSCRYNAIGRFSRITEVATRISNQLPGGGSSSAFKEFAWRFVNIIARALHELRQVPDYRKIRQYINDIEPLFIEYTHNYLSRTAPSGWAKEVKAISRSINERNLSNALRGRDPKAIALYKYVQEHEVKDPVLEGLISAFKYDRTYFDKIVSSVGPLMEKLTTGPVADLISPIDNDDVRPMLEWLDVIKNRGIVYVALDALSDATVASAVGNSMFADLVSVAGYLYKFGINGEGSNYASAPKVCIHADEFNELIGEEFIPLLNKAGGAGYQVTAYTQTMSDLEARVGSKAKSGQILGNFNSMIMLRVKELATAQLLTKQLPQVEVRGLKMSTGASDINAQQLSVEFQSRNDDQLTQSDYPLLTESSLTSLARGHAFALLDGAKLWKIQIPMCSPSDPCLPSSSDLVFESLEQRYWANQKQKEQDNSEQPVSESEFDSESVDDEEDS